MKTKYKFVELTQSQSLKSSYMATLTMCHTSGLMEFLLLNSDIMRLQPQRQGNGFF
jgi:hypothetical protein